MPPSPPALKCLRASLPGDGSWQGGWHQSLLPPHSCPRQLLCGEEQKGHPGVNMILEVAQELLDDVCEHRLVQPRQELLWPPRGRETVAVGCLDQIWTISHAGWAWRPPAALSQPLRALPCLISALLIPWLGSRALRDRPYQLDVAALVSSPQTSPTAASGLVYSVPKAQPALCMYSVQSFVLHNAGTRPPGNPGDAAQTKAAPTLAGWHLGEELDPICAGNTSASTNIPQKNLNSGLQPVLSLIKMRRKH